LNIAREPPINDTVLATRLAAGAAELKLSLSPSQVHTLVAFLRLIERWNATYNLTAVRDAAAMVTQHLLDCLAAAAALLRHRNPSATRRLLDVGSGAGLPGLVFAIVMPDTQVVCVDSVGKKTAFITHAAATLAIGNAMAVHARVETLRGPAYDVITSRAFATLRDFVGSTRQLLADNGEWMALKGKEPSEEIALLDGVSSAVESIDVPGLAAQRCIVWMNPLVSQRTLS